ncbi:MAG: hypothetical protein Nkreftii_002296 [Candidatus Nitrospira kreftii]|uniref:Uncharacterized protein n=1 Tax=Candidatus Nitrospira kreftii TaxID=2652173 RepID=A0A7S8FEV9_9BACT|nr:MAG: hypothetical protein Nkreftii_002296 [Candidatus Nitrospira kreftii]
MGFSNSHLRLGLSIEALLFISVLGRSIHTHFEAVQANAEHPILSPARMALSRILSFERLFGHQDASFTFAVDAGIYKNRFILT